MLYPQKRSRGHASILARRQFEPGNTHYLAMRRNKFRFFEATCQTMANRVTGNLDVLTRINLLPERIENFFSSS